MADWDRWGIQRRVAGAHHYRLDGLTDLLWRCRGASVLDLGCNRGGVSMDFANYGATLVHGVDNSEKCIDVCREIFADVRNVESQFECQDLTHGTASLQCFGGRSYDIVAMLATYHKLKRAMPEHRMTGMIKWLGEHTLHWFAWRGTVDQHDANDAEIIALDRDLGSVGLKRIHHSFISTELGVAAIWAR